MSTNANLVRAVPDKSILERAVGLGLRGNSEGTVKLLGPFCSDVQKIELIRAACDHYHIHDPVNATALQERIVTILSGAAPLSLIHNAPLVARRIQEIIPEGLTCEETSLRTQKFMCTVPFDVWRKHIGLVGSLSCSYVSKTLYQHLFNLVKTEALESCPLRKMDTVLAGSWYQRFFAFIKTDIFKIVEEVSFIDSYDLGKALIEIGSEIEENAGATWLVMREGLTLGQLVDMATDAGIHVQINAKVLAKLKNLCVKKTYRILITNNVFKKIRGEIVKEWPIKSIGVKWPDWHGHPRVVRQGFAGAELPSVLECVALCVLARTLFHPLPYRVDLGVIGMTSTRWGTDGHLCVTTYDHDRLVITHSGTLGDTSSLNDFCDTKGALPKLCNMGIGGVRKF